MNLAGLASGLAPSRSLKGEQNLLIAVPPKRVRRKRGETDYPHDPLFEVLRSWRRERASEQGVPPYVIFHDSTLREVAARKPASLTELSKIEGIGDTKLARHGESLLIALARAKEAEDAPAA